MRLYWHTRLLGALHHKHRVARDRLRGHIDRLDVRPLGRELVVRTDDPNMPRVIRLTPDGDGLCRELLVTARGVGTRGVRRRGEGGVAREACRA